MEIDVKMDDTLVRELEKELEYMSRMEVSYGYFPEQFHTEANLPTAYVADYNNNGVKNSKGGWHIPSRPFMDQAHYITEDDIPKFNAIMQDSLVLGGKMQIRTGLKMIGDQCADNIRESIDMQNFKELEPSTIAQKGGSEIQLIETNELYDSATYKIERSED